MKLIATRRRRDHLSRGGSGPSPGFKRSYPAVPASVPEARNALAQFAAAAGASREQVEAIRLAVSEALTNAVRFAYPARAGHVHVNAWVAAHELWVLVADNGCGLHAGMGGGGLGMGLALIAQMTDGFSVVERSSGGTELRLRFDLAATGPDLAATGPDLAATGPDPAARQVRGSVMSASPPA